MRESIEKSIVTFIEKLPVRGEPIALTVSTPLISSGLLDSIAAVELLIALEDAFGVSIMPEEINIKDTDTIGQWVELILSKNGNTHVPM